MQNVITTFSGMPDARQKKRMEEARAFEIKEMLFGLAMGESPDGVPVSHQTRIVAGVKYLEATIGRPAQALPPPEDNELSEMSEEDIRNELARLQRQRVDFEHGIVEARLSDEPE